MNTKIRTLTPNYIQNVFDSIGSEPGLFDIQEMIHCLSGGSRLSSYRKIQFAWHEIDQVGLTRGSNICCQAREIARRRQPPSVGR